MPGRVFTESERRRLDAFPSEIVESDLIRYFTLSASDLELVRQQRGDHNRLGFALQLCALRYLGFCPDDLVTAPPAAISFVADQLQVIPAALRPYGARPQTRTGHSSQSVYVLGPLQLEVPWPMWGLPELLQFDNAPEFHSRALVRGAQEYGIRIDYRPPGNPHLGGKA